MESQNTPLAELNSEIEPLRQMKNEVEQEKAKAEINSYYENIVKENGFSEAELNSLKADYVEKCDLTGLKEKEAELCINKFKELRKMEKVNAELNSSEDSFCDLFFSTKPDSAELNNSVDDGSDLF